MCYLRHAVMSTLCPMNRYFIDCPHGLYRFIDDVMPQVQCDNPRCKFSPMHPKSCQGASCKQTCKQYRGHPQQYSPQIAGLCPGCGGR
ncbi:hypothetical protein PYCCODRAFT_447286 [Trametes coccinea BRFM310]|uniref:Uncharacterized protein n=1 Tax=Trametes coccinea (strain BRFM310) TaxID=1353009 RepID=A0A1Y2IM14_TRAC3|nr:hypothetical protein PYCCODRAFT_447286 [Trametes coccinea BRFM310]